MPSAVPIIRTEHTPEQLRALYQAAYGSTPARFPKPVNCGSLVPPRRFAALEDRMSAGVEITRTDHTPPQLRAMAVKCGNAKQTRRLLAIALVLEGAPRAEAARQTGMDRQTLRDWVHRFNDLGIDGLISRRPPGRTAKLTTAQMATLRQLVVDGPDPKIHKVIRWRCVDLRAEVARRFSVTVDKITIGRWLGKLRLTRLQPRPYHPKKDPEAQEALKKTSATA